MWYAWQRIKCFLWQNLKSGDGFARLGVVVRIILKWNIMKYVRGWTG
jgi:hypothetical protein